MIQDGLLCQGCGFELGMRRDSPPVEEPVAEVVLPPVDAPLADARASVGSGSVGSTEEKPVLVPVLTAEERLARRRDSIRDTGETMEVIARVLFWVGLIGLVFGGPMALDDSDGFWVLAAAGAVLTAAMWLYLVAQIVYIRANTEK